MVLWIDSAMDNVLSLSAKYSTPKMHTRLRGLSRGRCALDMEATRIDIELALEDLKKPSGKEVEGAGASTREVEIILLSVASALHVAEDMVIACIRQMDSLQGVASSWSWLSSRPKRVAVAVHFMKDQTFEHLILQCDKKRDRSLFLRSTLAAAIGRVRRSIAALEGAASAEQLLNGGNMLMVTLESLSSCGDFEEMNEFVSTVRLPKTPSSFDPHHWMQVGAAAARKSLETSLMLIEYLPQAKNLIGSASRDLGSPPMMFRIWPAALAGGGVTIAALLSLRPDQIMSGFFAVFSSTFSATKSFVRDHLEEPAREIYKELFYPHGDGLNAWRHQAQISRESLERMIHTFSSKLGNVKLQRMDSNAGLDLVARIYEEQISRPVSNLLFGDMLQALLIQMQSLKANMEEEAASVHALMKANQLSLQIMAAVPAVFFVMGVAYGARRLFLWVMREPPHPRRHLVQTLRSTERLLMDINEQQAEIMPDCDDEVWGNLCFLIERMERLVSYMRLSPESREEIWRDLQLISSIKPTWESKRACIRFLLDSVARNTTSP
mmetsp:Transcript_3255/g.11006  ORF Transcript_3255/g.11006 Transcript_3255/m.11006 type:complete len:552 (-) Transcript_3255:2407-4062(-)